VPRLRLPHAVPYLASLADSLAARLLGRPPRIPLESVRLARHKMFVDCSKARRELGFEPGHLETALERAIRWYDENGYLERPLGNRVSPERAA
jgi:dihydroflavonol-4-reductase